MKKQSVTILDFSTGEVHIFPYDQDVMGEEFETIANCINDEYDILFRENDCQWMTGELKLKIH